MPGIYATLAPIYETIGMAAFAETMTPRLIFTAQSEFDWLGRQMLDLGCGTGNSARIMANRGMNVTAIDASPEMIDTARRPDESGLSLRWQTGDIRALSVGEGEYDYALALDVLNELGSLRDLETVFAGVSRALAPGKLFVFDLHTIEGMAERKNRFVYEDAVLNVFSQHQFDFERQTTTERMVIFRRILGEWTRQEVSVMQRGFPLQAAAALLTRCDFSVLGTLNTALQPMDLQFPRGDRAIFFAQKAG